MRLVTALIAGLIFGFGLGLSDMIDPARVRAFLDIAGGAWDPTLAFVMGGALLPMAAAWRFARRQQAPILGGPFPAPPKLPLDRPLIAGAVLFGAGWGLIGLCPGPALAALGLGDIRILPFVAAMLIGMLLHDRLPGRGREQPGQA